MEDSESQVIDLDLVDDLRAKLEAQAKTNKVNQECLNRLIGIVEQQKAKIKKLESLVASLNPAEDFQQKIDQISDDLSGQISAILQRQEKQEAEISKVTEEQ